MDTSCRISVIPLDTKVTRLDSADLLHSYSLSVCLMTANAFTAYKQLLLNACNARSLHTDVQGSTNFENAVPLSSYDFASIIELYAFLPHCSLA
jgi:hypothetical protein